MYQTLIEFSRNASAEVLLLSPVATKLRKGDIGLPSVRQSVRPSALNNCKTFGRILMISHTGL